MLYIRLEMHEYDLEVRKFIEMCDYLVEVDNLVWAGQVTAQEYASLVQIIDSCCAHTAESLPGSNAHRELTRPRRSKGEGMKINLGLGDFPAAKTDGSNAVLNQDGRVRSWGEPLKGHTYADCAPVSDGEKEKLLKGLEGIRREHIAKWGAPISPQPPLTLEYIQKLVSDAMEASILLTNELGDAASKLEVLKKQFEDREKVMAVTVQSRPSYSTEDYTPDSPKYRLEITRGGKTEVVEGVQLPSWLPETGLYEVFVEKE
jgi:hypothetical protein